MELKDRLQELRGSISQRKCAENLGVKFANYNKWENGINIPNYKTLIQIADYYGVSLDYLTGRVDYKDEEYSSVCIDTGLSEQAIKGIQKVRDNSSETYDCIGMLNCILESEYNNQYTPLGDFLQYVLYPDGFVPKDVLDSLKNTSLSPEEISKICDSFRKGVKHTSKEAANASVIFWHQEYFCESDESIYDTVDICVELPEPKKLKKK